MNSVSMMHEPYIVYPIKKIKFATVYERQAHEPHVPKYFVLDNRTNLIRKEFKTRDGAKKFAARYVKKGG